MQLISGRWGSGVYAARLVAEDETDGDVLASNPRKKFDEEVRYFVPDIGKAAALRAMARAPLPKAHDDLMRSFQCANELYE